MVQAAISRPGKQNDHRRFTPVVICDVFIFNEIDGTRTRSLQRDKLAI